MSGAATATATATTCNSTVNDVADKMLSPLSSITSLLCQQHHVNVTTCIRWLGRVLVGSTLLDVLHDHDDDHVSNDVDHGETLTSSTSISNIHPYTYDAIICDGEHALKVAISPSLYKLCNNGVISSRNIVCIEMVDVRAHEMNRDIDKFVVIMKVSFKEVADDSLWDKVKSAPYYTSHNSNILMQPLLGLRQYYLPLYTEYDYNIDDSRWMGKSLPVPDGFEMPPLKVGTIAEAVLNSGSPLVLPILVVRVMRKCCVHHYGKYPEGMTKRFPYQFSFDVGDGLGDLISVVVWQTAVPKYFNSLALGDVIVLSNYKVNGRKSYSTQDTHELPGKILTHELVVNLYNPMTLLFHAPPALRSDITKLSLPDLCLRSPTWISRNVPDEDHVGIAGLVVFVGRRERVKRVKPINGIDAPAFSLGRWILIACPEFLSSSGALETTTMKVEIPAEDIIPLWLESNSQMDRFDALSVSSLVVFTDLRVSGRPVFSSPLTRHVYLFSTHRTQIIIHSTSAKVASDDILWDPWEKIKTLKRLATWSKTTAALNLCSKRAFGGYFSYPPFPHTLEALCAHKSTSLISTELLPKVIEELQMYQRTTVHIKAICVRAGRIVHSSDEPPLKVTKTDESSRLDQNVAQVKVVWRFMRRRFANANPSNLVTRNQDLVRSFPIVNGCTEHTQGIGLTLEGLGRKVCIDALVLFSANSPSLQGDIPEFVNMNSALEKSESSIDQCLKHMLSLPTIICVLDLYRHSVNDVEVCLKAAYQRFNEESSL